MGLSDLFSHGKKRGESVLLIDVGATAVAGAYVRYEGDELPNILYTRRAPIEMHEGEAHERAMLRTLETLGNDILREGSPALYRAVGSGTADFILVSVDAPWQETTIRTESFEEKESFLFTRSLVTKRLTETDATPAEQILVDESVIGAIVNGYETNNPYGKKIDRASIFVLTSRIDARIAHGTIGVLRTIFHTKHIMPIAGSSLRYQAIRTVFPHEKNVLVLDATSPDVTSISLIRNGFFVMMSHTASGDGRNEANSLSAEISEIAAQYPLPRTIFLLARESDIATVRDSLTSANLEKLWISDNPPTIVPIFGSQITEWVKQATVEPADTILLLMTVYYQHRLPTDIG